MRTSHAPDSKTTAVRTAVRVLVAGFALASARGASAQPIDTAPPLPNVLLLLDSSGSMEQMIDGSNAEDAANNVGGTTGAKCTGNAVSVPNRWGTAVQALTGDFNTFSCVREPRTRSTAFDTEYSISGKHPYDLAYFLDYHRPAQPIDATHACVYGHDGTATGWPAAASPSPPRVPSDFAAAAITGYKMDLTTNAYGVGVANQCTFNQQANGALDAAAQMVRFGLMTFDNDTDATVATSGYPTVGTGVNVTAVSPLTFTSNSSDPFTGMWSYYAGWDSNTMAGASRGHPLNCSTDPFFEVGARNPAAPPWEGRMIRFADPAIPSQVATVNDQIQRAINVMRPYGANPIAGMMDDAKYYYWSDPQGPGAASGGDPYVKGGCRQQYIILFTHAAPNLDLQNLCQAGVGTAAGKCPYDYSENIAYGLSHGAYAPGTVPHVASAVANGQPVLTYVIGFAMSSFTKSDGTQASCNDVLNADGSINTAVCANAAYSACCTLQKIAVAGGTKQAYFADSRGALDNAFGVILGAITRSVSTRTTPVLSPQVSGTVSATGGAQQAVFVSSFTPSPAVPWSGDVERQRLMCSYSSGAYASQAQTVDQAKGDDFAKNMDLDHTTQRHVLAVEPNTATGVPRSPSGTLRPYMKGAGSPSITGLGFDGLTLYDGTEYEYDYTVTSGGAAVTTSEITPDALSMTTVCPVTKPGTAAPGTPFDLTSCETIAWNFALGMQNGPATWPSGYTFPGRFYSGSDRIAKSSFGDVFHSTPVVVGPPSASLRDDSYESFVTQYTTLYHANGDGKSRKTVLYVATNDGLLHAFGTDYDVSDNTTFNTLKNNELWSFVPPAVMPNLISAYPTSHQLLLDGAPVVKDTVYQRTGAANGGNAADWHTTLVAGFGAGGPGYYALDVTDPEVTTRLSHSFGPVHGASNANTPVPYAAKTGPHFLWQITDSALFGQAAATPAITTVFADTGEFGGTSPREIGVAILPGGGTTVQSGTCARSPNATTATSNSKRTLATPPSTSYVSGTTVRKWAAGGCLSAVRGRSVSIVRLDTGEVIRTFARADLGTNEPSLDLPATHPLRVSATTNSTSGTPRYASVGRVTDTPLDSPMTGTPLVYPSDVGSLAQKFFISDADGTLWRFDISSPNPNDWYGEVFLDGYNATAQSATGFAADATWGQNARQAGNVTPLVSVGRDGNLVVNFTTGDTNNVGTPNTYPNFAWSVSEIPQVDTRLTSTTRLLAQVNWFKPFTGGEMVSGPMAVFDGNWLFTTYAPALASSACQLGIGRLWGMDFVTPYDTANPPSTGGAARLPDPSTAGVYRQSFDQGNFVIPGVTIASSLACTTASAASDAYAAGATHTSMANLAGSGQTFSAMMVGGKPASGSGSATVGSASPNAFAFSLPQPRSPTVVDSWAAIVE